MPDTCWSKVEDAVKAALDAAPALDGWTVLVGQSSGAALDAGTPTICIWTMSNDMDQFEYDSQTIHRQTLDIEFIKAGDAIGVLTRDVLEAMADAHAALAADRSLGGILQDLQEDSIAPTVPEGRDVLGQSVQYVAEFFTPRNDWRTFAT